MDRNIKRILVLTAILILTAIACSCVYAVTIKETTDTTDKYDTIEEGSYIKVDLVSLVQLNYIKEVKDYISNNLCKGYTLSTKDSSGITNIKGYLNCDNYVSKGYEY